MTKETNGAAPEPTAPRRPTLTIVWSGEGEADMSMTVDGVLPSQLYGAAWYLDAVARETRQGQVTQAAMRGLAIAPSDVLADLRRAGKL